MKQRSKTTLFLMELVLMILFFAVSAAICMRVFATAQLKSRTGSALSNAALKVQSAAECWKFAEGDIDFVAEVLSAEKTDGGIVVYMDKGWRNCGKNEAEYVLELERDGYYAQIEVAQIDDNGVKYSESVFALTVKAVPNGK